MESRTRYVKAGYILSAAALAWVAGILLLNFTHVYPRLNKQAELIERDMGGDWLRVANVLLRARKNQLLRFTSGLAGRDETARYLQQASAGPPGQVVKPQVLERQRLSALIFADSQGRVISAWSAGPAIPARRDSAVTSGGKELEPCPQFQPGQSLAGLSLFTQFPNLEEYVGLARTPLGLALFARCRVEGQGYLLSLRTLDEPLLAELSAGVGAHVWLSTCSPAPADQAVPPYGQLIWHTSNKTLCGAQVLRDCADAPAGYLVVLGANDYTAPHAITVERSLTTTLLWAVGYAVLMVLVIHVVVTGPTAKLLDRVERLRAGEPVESLSRNLRGEALALARQFEEVLAHVEKLSQTDALTGLANRRSFQTVFVQEYRRARRYAQPLALMVLDIDFFKAVNDALGHASGDAMLITFAQMITSSVRDSDIVSRLGGDEFAILMPETHAQDAAMVGERIRAGLAEKSVGHDDLKMSPTISIGVVDMTTPGADTPDAFLDLGDQALYAAKRAGRNQVVRADQISQQPMGADDANRVDHLSKQVARLDAKFKRLFVDAIGGLISALEARDIHTANHSVKVRRYATLIARAMKLAEDSIEHVARAAMLHDIGKIGLPDSVLLKEGPLEPSEWELVRRHPVMSVQIMEGMAFLEQEIPAVRHHHERYDGKGYPEGLSGSAIPVIARILSVADAFDAMTSSRVYRNGMTVASALAELRNGSGKQFDPTVVEVFLGVVQREGITDQWLAEVSAPAKSA